MSADSIEKDLVDTALRRVHRYLDDGIDGIGGLSVAAGVCGYDRSDLRRALDRNGRKLALDHAIAIAARIKSFNRDLATRIGGALVDPLDLQVFPRVTLTDKERADRLEAAMRAMPMGAELVANILGGSR